MKETISFIVISGISLRGVVGSAHPTNRFLTDPDASTNTKHSMPFIRA
jgi:hypothetical protein